MSIKSVTFYYRNPNVIITNKLPDGYAVDKASGTALLNSSYEFTVTWNPEEYRTPTVKWNGVTMIPVNKKMIKPHMLVRLMAMWRLSFLVERKI